MRNYYVYILASKRNGTLYTGVTSDIATRVWQHKTDVTPGFTSRYKVTQLVYFELFEDVSEAIYRKKQIKSWKRKWKLQLIEADNPNWEDLYFF